MDVGTVGGQLKKLDYDGICGSAWCLRRRLGRRGWSCDFRPRWRRRSTWVLVMTCDKVLVVAVLGSLATAAVWLEQGLLVLGEMVEEMTMLVTGSVATRSMGRCRCFLDHVLAGGRGLSRIEREEVQAQKELVDNIVCRGSVYRAPNLMVGASPCALDVAPLAYATAINHCARKECFEAGRTEKIHGGSKDFNLGLLQL